jgi:hypothetical protein
MNPWEMIRDDFVKTVKFRIYEEPEITIKEWAKKKGIPESDVSLHEFEIGAAIGSLVFPTQNRTRVQAGKEKVQQLKFFKYTKLANQYYDEVPKIKKSRPIRIDRKDDQAYMRILHRRSVMKALGDGETVSPMVLKDYPEMNQRLKS